MNPPSQQITEGINLPSACFRISGQYAGNEARELPLNELIQQEGISLWVILCALFNERQVPA